jgi:hypothetical protein
MTWDTAGELSARREHARQWLAEEESETIRMVAHGYTAFWARRRRKPPGVSDTVLETTALWNDPSWVESL